MSSSPETPSKTPHGRDGDSLHTLMLYRIGRSTAWIAFFALVLAAAAGAAGWLLWNQLAVMQDQSDTLQDLSEKVQKALDASRTQSETLATALQAISTRAEANANAAGGERPWVGIERISVAPLRANEKPSVSAVVRNTGRSPALNLAIVLNASTDENSGGEPQECGDCPRAVLLPNAALNVDVGNERPSSPATADSILRGTKKLTVSGRIDYQDLSGRSHKTFVCFTYRPQASAFSACPAGNRFD